MRRAQWILVLVMGCAISVALAGCGEVATTDDTLGETTTTVPETTTTSAATSWTLEPGAPKPMGSAALVGSWSRREGSFTVFLHFLADGEICWSSVGDNPEEPGDAVYGTWRANDTRIWVYGIGMAEWSCSYTIEDGVLRMPEPGMSLSEVYEWR